MVSPRPCIYVMLRLLILATAITVTLGDQHDNKVDIGATVQEVEAMLAKDPRLPRLTRGEILKLIDEVRTGKDVVVVLPDNTSTEGFGSSTTAKPKKVKRRRKKPTTVRPVYVHATTADEQTSSASSTVASSEISSTSSTESNEWIPSSTSRPRIKLTPKPMASGPQSESPGVLPPIPGLDVVEGINSWTGTGGNKQTEPSIYITPSPPVPDSPMESPPNIKAAAESLGPEMKDLLTKFGLLGETTTEKFYQGGHPAPTIDPEVYSRFKPLPVKSSAEAVAPDMKSFLASFGLLDSRQGKEMKTNQEANSPLEYIPDYHKNILTQLGLFKNGKAIDLSGLDAKRESPKHVFNPNKLENADRKAEFEKVSKILTKLKEIGEGDESKLSELSPSDIEELLSLEKNTRLAAEEQAYLEDESKGFDGEKNDVKRAPQGASLSASVSAGSKGFGSASVSASVSAGVENESQTSAAASAESDSTADESTSPSTLEEPTTTAEASSSDSGDTTERGASAVDLEASFGNGDTTTKRPNGFYFLLDWNSFLDVGLDDRAIHLNFSPKVGDPKNFLPVVIGNSQQSR
ncbi:Hypothetical protein NTJ_06378 [Nesidiocoris tenuis]|uniref:LEM domain-containing protein n=1 Tax=Nesidiocoris tenuis TaxID=355587 RepID=A0ABN7AQK4_9HEMI|nr:Hypothetical protein NTJ_06378 [Nesidiocoris tenuis]